MIFHDALVVCSEKVCRPSMHVQNSVLYAAHEAAVGELNAARSFQRVPMAAETPSCAHDSRTEGTMKYKQGAVPNVYMKTTSLYAKRCAFTQSPVASIYKIAMMKREFHKVHTKARDAC